MKGLLKPLGSVFSTLVALRNWMYDNKMMKTGAVRKAVISVGNITMGGTGKTPFIHWLIQEIETRGYHPGVVSRNYGSSFRTSEWVDSKPNSVTKFGDEAVLLKTKNPEVPMISGPLKWQSALKMDLEGEGVDVILVDDGFQHRRLRRDLDIVLLDVSVSIHDYYWPPMGRARESLKGLARADIIVFTRWEQRRDETIKWLQSGLPQKVITLQAEQVSGPIQRVAGAPLKSKSAIKNGTGLAFCGLGNPDSFIKTLNNQSLTIGEFMRFADHMNYEEDTLARILKAAEKFDYVITSEKDFIKLQNWPFNGPTLCVIPLEIKVAGAMEAFLEKMDSILRKDIQ